MIRCTASLTVSAAFLLAAAGSFPGCALAQRSGGVVSTTPDVADEQYARGDDDATDDGVEGAYHADFDGRVLRLEADDGTLLMEQQASKFGIARMDGALVPEVEFEAASDGYSLHYRFYNDTGSPKPLSMLRVGPIFLGDDVTYQDMRHSCDDVVTSASSHKTPGHNYPINMYAPVWIVRSGDHAAGISLEYPLLDYQHDVRIFLKYHSGSGGWQVDLKLSDDGDDLDYSASVPPGETWEYTVNVRFTSKSSEWVRTLLPYREFFRETYGGLQYIREIEPVNSVGLSLMSSLSDDNPYGFSREHLRPDQLGYGPFVDFVLEREGWGEYMIVTPTGHQARNTHLNYPFRFTSQWSATDMLNTATDPAIGFPRIVAEGHDLGFWWGRAAQVSYAWDDGIGEQLDPSNRAHVEEAFAELDGAIAQGARTVGLDTFGYRAIPTWDAVEWLQMMRNRHPGVKFVLEPMPADIMHRLGAGWLRGFNDGQPVDSLEELNFIKGPHVLADFLLPGHETWAGWRYKGHRNYLDIEITQDLVNEDVIRFAAWGYRPMLYTEFELIPQVGAAPSWTFTIPPDLQIPADGFAPSMDNGSGDNDGDDDGQGRSGSRGSLLARGGTAYQAQPTNVSSISTFSGSASLGVTGEEARAALERAKIFKPATGKMRITKAGEDNEE